MSYASVCGAVTAFISCLNFRHVSYTWPCHAPIGIHSVEHWWLGETFPRQHRIFFLWFTEHFQLLGSSSINSRGWELRTSWVSLSSRCGKIKNHSLKCYDYCHCHIISWIASVTSITVSYFNVYPSFYFPEDVHMSDQTCRRLLYVKTRVCFVGITVIYIQLKFSNQSAFELSVITLGEPR